MTGWQDWINKGMNSLFDWYRSPSQNEFDYNAKQFVRNIPLIGGMFQADDSSRMMNDYLKNRGLSWSNIRYNQAPFGATYGSSLAAMTPNVSAMSLYRSMSRPSRSAYQKEFRKNYDRISKKMPSYRSSWRSYRPPVRGGAGPPLRAYLCENGLSYPPKGDSSITSDYPPTHGVNISHLSADSSLYAGLST